MNFTMIRGERIKKLVNKLQRIENALKTYPYTNSRDILEDLAALEATEKEIQVQAAYAIIENQ